MSTGMLVLTPKALEKAVYLYEKLSKSKDKLNYKYKIDNHSSEPKDHNEGIRTSTNTSKGADTNDSIVIYAPFKLKNEQKIDPNINAVFYEDPFSAIVEQAFLKHTGLIFIMASGIVVRSIAPYLKDKISDPAVVVMDEELEFCISLAGGHVAGANELCKRISNLCGSTSVITTSTDVNKKGALDIIAKRLGDYRASHRDLYKRINYKLACSEKVYMISDIDAEKAGIDIRGFDLISAEDAIHKMEDTVDIIHIKAASPNNDFIEKLKAHPEFHQVHARNLVLGIGCRKDTSFEQIRTGFEEFIKEFNIDKNSIKRICSIDLKKNEQGIKELAENLSAEFLTYTSEEINNAIDNMQSQDLKISSSAFVKSITGAVAVAEPACFLGSGGNIAVGKQIKNKVTFSLGVMLHD